MSEPEPFTPYRHWFRWYFYLVIAAAYIAMTAWHADAGRWMSAVCWAFGSGVFFTLGIGSRSLEEERDRADHILYWYRREKEGR